MEVVYEIVAVGVVPRAVETAGGDSWSREDGTVDGMWTT